MRMFWLESAFTCAVVCAAEGEAVATKSRLVWRALYAAVWIVVLFASSGVMVETGRSEAVARRAVWAAGGCHFDSSPSQRTTLTQASSEVRMTAYL